MLVLLLALLMQGDLRQFYESVTSTAENVDASAPPSVPVRREDREANERQPEAVLRPSARPAARWSAKVDATLPCGGKNNRRKSSGLGPFFGATKEDAEAARDKALTPSTLASSPRLLSLSELCMTMAATVATPRRSGRRSKSSARR